MEDKKEEEKPGVQVDPNMVTDQMIKIVLEELFAELDKDDSGTMEKIEVEDYSKKMLMKLRPRAEFKQQVFDQNFHRLDTFGTNWVNRDTLFRFVLQKAIATGALDMNTLSEEGQSKMSMNLDY